MALSGRAAAAAVAAVLVILAFRTTAALVITDAVLLAAIAADVVLAAPVKNLTIERRGDTRVRLGERASVTTTIVNTSGRKLRARVRDGWPPSANAAPSATTLRITARSQGALTATLAPERRGGLTSDTVTVRSFGPMGLAARQRSLTRPHTVRALPPFRSRRHLPAKLARLRQLDGQHKAVQRGQGSEFDSLREYVIGDDVRSIDWRSSARRREVLVRTWRPERDRRIVFVLDTGRTSAGRVGGYPRLDTAMDAVQLLTALASQAGDRVDLIAADERVRARVLAPARTSALAAVTDAMAGIEPRLTEPDGRLLATSVLTHARRRCLVVLLTDLNPSVTLLPEFRAVAVRHELLVGAVADPATGELAAGRGEAARVYAAAAASRSLSERINASAALTRLGATVVDAPPERLPSALADAYLSLKSAGRLLSHATGSTSGASSMSPVRPARTARRPNPSAYPANALTATAPTVIRAQAGRCDGVTNASMIPDTPSTTIIPIAIVTVDRPSSAIARTRGRFPGSITVQPSRSPAAADRNTADSSSIPCGRIRLKNSAPLPCAIRNPPSTPPLSALTISTHTVGMPSRMPKIRASAATHTLLVHTWAANAEAGLAE